MIFSSALVTLRKIFYFCLSLVEEVLFIIKVTLRKISITCCKDLADEDEHHEIVIRDKMDGMFSSHVASS